MTDRDDRRAVIDELRRQVRELSDRLEILQLLASYGPAVDSGSAEATAALWTEDGSYDTFPHPLVGRAAIADMVRGERHQSYVHNGCGHLIGIPHIRLDGDTAVVTGYSQLVLRDEAADGFRVWRTAVNRWELVRTGEGWRVAHRVNRLLDGSAESHELLADAVRPPQP